MRQINFWCRLFIVVLVETKIQDIRILACFLATMEYHSISHRSRTLHSACLPFKQSIDPPSKQTESCFLLQIFVLIWTINKASPCYTISSLLHITGPTVTILNQKSQFSFHQSPKLIWRTMKSLTVKKTDANERNKNKEIKRNFRSR